VTSVRCAPRLLLLWVAGGAGGLGEVVSGIGKSGELFFDGGPWRIKWPRMASSCQSRSAFLPVLVPCERRRRGDGDDFGLSFISGSFFGISGGFPVFAGAGRGRFVFHLCERVESLGAPGGALLVCAVGLACSGGLDVWSPVRPAAADSVSSSFLLVAVAVLVQRQGCVLVVPATGFCGSFKALKPLLEEEDGLCPVPASSAGSRCFFRGAVPAAQDLGTFASNLIFSRILCVSFGPCRMCFAVCVVFSSFSRGLLVKGTG